MSLLEMLAIRLPREASYVRRAQLRSLSRQFTLLYVALFSNTTALAFQFNNAPLWLTLGPPVAIVPFAIVRVMHWRRLEVDNLDEQGVTRLLRTSTLVVTTVAILFTLWSFALSSYAANEEVLAEIVFFLAIVIIATMSCLVHLRFAGLLLVCLVVLPTSGMLLLRGFQLTATIALDLSSSRS